MCLEPKYPIRSLNGSLRCPSLKLTACPKITAPLYADKPGFTGISMHSGVKAFVNRFYRLHFFFTNRFCTGPTLGVDKRWRNARRFDACAIAAGSCLTEVAATSRLSRRPRALAPPAPTAPARS